ncbi:MAG: penicillin acylase family protein [Chitinophagales bacterium]
MKKIILGFGILIGLNHLYAQEFPIINPENIDIVRDEWGVPHIFGKTDAEAGYGLAWANAEDNFKDMQGLLIIGKGMSGRAEGVEGAKADYFRHVIQAEAIVAEKKPEMPEAFLKYIDGYVQGANAYAEAHPEGVLVKKAFPMTIDDVLCSYVVAMSFLTGASGDMEAIYNGNYDDEPVHFAGSNAYAVNGTLTEDGNTYVCTNPHLQMEGIFSFYEAHIASEEGLNMHGSLFYGGTSVFMGNNENMGWGMTWNHFDGGDAYKLKMHPDKKLMYEYDGEWLKLEKKKTTLKVKVGKLVIPVPKKSYWSELGPVVRSSKNKDEFYAFKYPSFMDATTPLQLYEMNKAETFDDFKTALDHLGLGMFNIVYGDKEQNIYYVSFGQIPLRTDSLVNLPIIPGNESKYVWDRIYTREELPHVENPASGFALNCNNTPFNATAEGENDDKDRLPDFLDKRPGDNNRSTVLHEFFASEEKISWEEFQAIKFDNSFSPDAYIVQAMDSIYDLRAANFPDIEDIITNFQNWDMVADKDDVSAATVMVVLEHIFSMKGYGDAVFIEGFDASVNDFIVAFRQSKAWLLEHHGTVDVPLGDIFIARRGDREVSSPGFPDALAANYARKGSDGKYTLNYGDTYTHFVNFDENGVVEMRTSVPFGNSSDPESPFFFNQAEELFQHQKTKEMTLDKETIYQNAYSIYHPE